MYITLDRNKIFCKIRTVFCRNQERWSSTNYHIFTVEDIRHGQRFIVRLSSRTSKRFGRNSDYMSWQTFRSRNASSFMSDNICWNTHNAQKCCVFFLTWKARREARRDNIASFATRWKSDSEIGRTFFLKPICKKHALVENEWWFEVSVGIRWHRFQSVYRT